MPHAMKTNEPLDPVAIGLFSLVGQIPAANQRPELVHEASRVVWQFWWYIQDHTISLHAVFIYSIVEPGAHNCTTKSGDIRQLSEKFVLFGF